MIDKSIMVIMFMYAASASILAVQITMASAYDITLVNLQGEPIKEYISGYMNEQGFNTFTANIANGTFNGNTTYYDRIETQITAAAAVAWELITLLTGTYIFNIMYLLGVPYPFVLVFVILYVILLARTIVGLLRGA